MIAKNYGSDDPPESMGTQRGDAPMRDGYRLLDLYCAAGGSAMGYSRAGFTEIVGVDNQRQQHYPFTFHREDALAVLDRLTLGYPLSRETGLTLADFDAIHASPPCQAYTRKAATWGRARTHFTEHPDLLGPTRLLLEATGKPYVIENVLGAPINASLMLCGSMFGLAIQKHRYFEGNWALPFSPATCHHDGLYNPWAGAGRSAVKLREAQGTPWIPMSGGASRKAGVTGDLFNAIPPAFTEYLGRHLILELDRPVLDGGSA